MRFYLEKVKLLTLFLWWREWGLFREEWKLSYSEYREALDRSGEISAEATERLLRAIKENTGA